MESLEEHNEKVQEFHRDISKPKQNGISCPVCGAELMDSNPCLTLLSYPPQFATECSECDYTGTRL